MSRNITNTPSKTNVYVNTIDVFEGTLPVVVTQTSANQPVNISLKGLTALGPANNVIKMNSTGTELIYSEDSGSNWTLDGSNLYPLSTSTNILIGTQSNANGYGILSSGKEIAIEESASSTNDPTLRLINGTNNATIKLDDSGDMFFSDATNKYSFTKKLELNFTGAELTDGTNDFTLPSSTGTLALSSDIPQDTSDLTNGAGFITASSTDTLTNKSMSYSQLTGTPSIPTNNNQLINGRSFITASSSDTLTNKTIASFTNGSSNTITVPSSAGTLALSSDIPTDNLFLSNGAGYITASSTDTLTNKSMSYSQLTGTPTIPTNNNQLTNGAGYITASSTDTLTNKSMSYSQLTGTPTIPSNNNELTNGAGYITASSTDTLTNKSMSYSQLTGTPTIPTNNNQLTNGAGYITASSTDTLTNKTIINFTGGSNASLTMPSQTGIIALDANIPTLVSELTNDLSYVTPSGTATLANKTITSFTAGNLATITCPSTTGTLALTDDIPSNSTANGFTGLTSYTKGDILFYNTGTTFSKLAIGTQGQVLKCSSTGVVEWANDTSTGLTATVPIVITNNDISYDISSLTDATLALTDNVFVQQGTNLRKTTFTAIKTLVDTTATSNNFGTSSTGDISIGNTTHATTIYGVNTILNSEERSIITFTPAQNKFEIGNSTDKTRIFVPEFYGSSGTSKRLGILDTNLNNEIIFNTPTLTADITLTMPDTTGTLALFSEIPTNNNQLSNGRGFITASSTDTLTNKSMSYSQLTGTPTIPTIPGATAPIVLTGGNYTLPATSYTTITEVPNSNLILMVDSEDSYKKVTVNNFVQLYQDTINYSADLPIVKDTTNDKYTFSLSGLTAAAQAQVEDQMIMLMGVAGFNTFRRMTGLQLQQYITNEGVSFGTNIADLGDRVFGNGSRDSRYNGKTTYIQSLSVDRISILGDLIQMPRSGTDLRVAHTTDTNAFSSASTTCKISSINDLHLFSPGQSFSGSLNRFVCMAGNSQSETALFGYAGSSIAIANGGIPNGHTTNPIGSAFVMSTGTGGVFTIANRQGINFSQTITQFQINQQDTDFYTDNVTINGGTSTEAILTLNSNNGAIHVSSVGQIIGYSNSSGKVQLGSSFIDAEAKGNIFYVKQLRVTNFINTGLTDLKLAVNNSNRILISYSNSSYILMGEKAASATPNPEAAVHICNVGSTTNSQNARLRIESRKSTLDPVLEFVTNTGTDSATRNFAYVYADETGYLYLTSAGPTSRYVIIYNRIQTNSFNYFLNMNGTTGFQLWTSASAISSTGSYFWRQWVNGEYSNNNGNFLFDYSSQNGSWGQRAYISSGTSSYVQMNFTGQHRCVPEEEDLYDNVDDYIGMIVESTGLYNSMDFEEYEETVNGISVVDAYTDPQTGIKHPETRTPTSHIEKKTRVVYTTEPTINDCEPIVKLTTTAKSKKVFGVISHKEDVDGNGARSFLVGNFGSTLGDKTDNRLYINSLGEGGILVCNENGNIENGDYLCSSSITGIAMKQDDDLMHNYTIAKATMDYNFVDADERKLIGCTYHCG